jgi:hypothetical protein
MSHIELCGYDNVTGRNLFMLELVGPDDVPSRVNLKAKYFGAFIAWDARSQPANVIVSLLAPLIEAGCRYFVCWGPDCERVHDIADECDPFNGTNAVIMTTWHTDETLEDALWFFLNNAFPDPAFEDDFHSSLAITIGSPSWASAVRTALLDPRAFSGRILATGDV